MHLYTTHDWEGIAFNAHGTLTEAHAAAKQQPNVNTVQIRLYDVPTDKKALVKAFASALLGERHWEQFELPSTCLRTWELTSRGGLKEITGATE